MPKPAKTIDAFLKTLDADKRAALTKLRRELHAILPGAEECMSYGVPGLRLDGKLVISFGAGKNHCALYPGAAPVETYAQELARYETSRGTIRFAADAPLPKTLLRKVVKAAAGRVQKKPARRSDAVG